MKTLFPYFVTLSFLLPAFLFISTDCHGQTRTEKKVEMEIGINREQRDVGLKRMELLDKMLSSELLEKKRNHVHKVEQDYNKKIMELINSIIAPVAQNKVITHIDVNFFSPEFETEVYASKKTSVSIILRYGALKRWSMQHNSEKEALDKLKELIQTTFKIPPENISITSIR